MKKLCSLLLVIALLISAVPLTLASAEEDTVTVIADGVSYQVHQGDTIEYVRYLNIGEKATSMYGTLTFDSSGVSINVPVNEDNEEDMRLAFPVIADNVSITPYSSGYLSFNFSDPFGKSFAKDTSELIRVSFTVTASSGTYSINSFLMMLVGESGTRYYYNSELVPPLRFESELTVSAAPEPGTEPETSAPSDEPVSEPDTEQPTTPDGEVFVIADGVKYRVAPGETIEYVYYLNIGMNLCSLDAELDYSDDGLELIVPYDENEEEYKLELIFPIIGGGVTLKENVGGRIRYTYSNTTGRGFKKNTSQLVRAEFKVKASEGTYAIDSAIKTLAGENEHVIISEYEMLEEPFRSEGAISNHTPVTTDPTDAPATDEPTGNPATESTDAPATEPPATESTDAPATESPATESTDAPATESPATESPATDAPTDKPTEKSTDVPGTEPPAGEAYVIADGKKYSVTPGEEFEYVYYLNIGMNLCSLHAELTYSTDGLELIIPYDEEEEEENIFLIFPIIKDNVTLNSNDPGRLLYAYSHTKGKAFKKSTSELVRAKFRVKASARGTYYIDTAIKTLAGENEHVFISDYEIVEEPFRYEGCIPAKTPVTPDPTQPATVMPTDAPETQPATAKPTDAPETQPVTVMPTDAPATQPVTAKPTDVPETQPVTAKPTDAPATEPSTGEVYVIADGTKYAVTCGEIIEFVYYLNIGERLCSLDGDLYYDTDGLELIVPYDEEEEEEDIYLVFPIIKDGVTLNANTPGRLLYVYAHNSGKSFKNDNSVLIRAQFRVTATEGTYEITNILDYVAGENEHDFIRNGETLDAPKRCEGVLTGKEPCAPDTTEAPGTAAPTTETSGTVTEAPTNKPTEAPATAAPTNKPTEAPATAAPTNKPTEAPATAAPTNPSTEAPVTEPATAKPTAAPETETPTEPSAEEYDLYVVADGERYRVTPGEVIDYVYYLNIGERMCSLDACLYYDADGLELIVPYDEEEEEENINLIFPVIKDTVTTNGNQPGRILYVYSSSKGKSFKTDSSVLVQAQFRVTATEGTYEINNIIDILSGEDEHPFIKNNEIIVAPKYLAGSLSGKEPLPPEETEPSTDEPTAAPETAAPTEPATDKPTAAPETAAPTVPATDEPTAAPETAAPTEPATDKPTEAPETAAPTEPAAKAVFVKADGVLYKVKQNEVFDYYYYLNINDKVCSIQADLYYDTAGLELIIPLDEDDDPDFGLMFPQLPSVMANPMQGRVPYNYSSTRGKPFNTDDSVLVHAQFRVLADDGVYEINNIIDTIAGPDELKYYYLGQEVIPVQRMEGEIAGKKPYDPDNPESTEEPTAAPTVPATEKPTVPATEPATEKPTVPPTEPPTAPPTGKPTRPPYLLDEATGIRVYTDLDAELVVTEIAPKDFERYLFNSGCYRIFDVRLVKDGKEVVPTGSVTVMIPAQTCKTVYRYDNGRFVFAQAVDDSGFRKLTTNKLGIFIGLTDYINPKSALYGDVDINGEISILDATYIQRWLADLEVFSNDQILIGDVDANDDTSVLDATYIQRWLADLPESVETRLPKH